MQLFRIIVLICGVCAAASPLIAQQSVDVGSISGRVMDPSGAVVAGAQITARQTRDQPHDERHGG